jgi:hypothetical protein
MTPRKLTAGSWGCDRFLCRFLAASQVRCLAFITEDTEKKRRHGERQRYFGLASGRGWQNVKDRRRFGFLRTTPRKLTAGSWVCDRFLCRFLVAAELRDAGLDAGGRFATGCFDADYVG